jgi:rhodanese-related sulfurtransferase
VGAGQAQVIDTRPGAEYGQGHIPGSLNIGLDGRYAEWAGTVLAPLTPLILVCSTGREQEAAMRLARIGYENVVGILEGGMPAWRAEEQEVRTLRRIDVQELRRLLAADEIRVLDVRGPGEWNGGHIEGAIHHPLVGLVQGQVPEHSGPFAVFCGTDYRSSIACGLLERSSPDTATAVVIGGMGAWKDAKLPLVQPVGAG